MVDVLFFRPNFELATQYLFAWFGLGIDEAERLGYRVIDLPGEAATLDNLLDALQNYTFSSIILGGHGNPNTFTGQDYEEILKACQNDEVCSGNIALLLSCFTGQELGPSMVKKNTVAFIGWQSDFRFMIDTGYPILDDPLAEPFKEIAVESMARLLRGQTIRNIWDGTIAKCDEWINRVSARPEFEWSQVIDFIEHDRNGMICLGEKLVSPISPSRMGFIPILSSLGIGSVLTYLAV